MTSDDHSADSGGRSEYSTDGRPMTDAEKFGEAVAELKETLREEFTPMILASGYVGAVVGFLASRGLFGPAPTGPPGGALGFVVIVFCGSVAMLLAAKLSDRVGDD